MTALLPAILGHVEWYFQKLLSIYTLKETTLSRNTNKPTTLGMRNLGSQKIRLEETTGLPYHLHKKNPQNKYVGRTRFPHQQHPNTKQIRH